MTDDQSSEALTNAHGIVVAWVRDRQPGEYPTNPELARAFCALLPADANLELRTTRNPSALVYEARWYHRGTEAAEFPKPFCADTAGDAEVLACAAMIALPD